MYVRGNTIKYIRVPDEVIDMVKEETFRKDGAFLQGTAQQGRVHAHPAQHPETWLAKYVTIKSTEKRPVMQGGRGGRGRGPGRGGRGEGACSIVMRRRGVCHHG